MLPRERGVSPGLRTYQADICVKWWRSVHVSAGVVGLREASHAWWAWALCACSSAPGAVPECGAVPSSTLPILMLVGSTRLTRCIKWNPAGDLTELRVVARRLHIRVELVVVTHREDRPARTETVGHARETRWRNQNTGRWHFVAEPLGSVGSRRHRGWLCVCWKCGGETC